MRRRSATTRTFFTAWLCLSLLAGLWAIATPLAAAPDEPAHLIKAASVARGQFVGVAGENGHAVTVPAGVAFTHAQTCFAFNPEQSAGCAPSTPPGDGLVETTTTAGLYNPLYYALVGWPSLVFDGEVAVYGMRIASALLTSALLALSFLLVASWRHRAIPTIGLLAAVTPLTVFIAGVVNPSGPEIAGVLTVTVAVLSLVRHPDDARTTQRVVVLAIAGSVAMNMRGISPLWVAIAVLLPVALARGDLLRTLFQRHAVRLAATITAAAGGFALLWTTLSNSLGSAIADGEVETDYPGVGTHPVVGFLTVLTRSFQYASGMVAEFGWADTIAPPATIFVLSLLIGGTILFAISVLRGRERVVVLAALTALVMLPALIQASYVTQGGYIWQGRYAAPMLGILLVVAAALLGDAVAERAPSRVINTLLGYCIALWCFAQLESFVTTLGRYAVGTPIAWGEFLRAPEWSPPGGVAILCCAFVLTLVACARAGWFYGRAPSESGTDSALTERERPAVTR
ncbi:hypothetical protein ASC66_02500 [Leifsonia sp. Root4]|uniref:DUF2142 domain-containing protein n=1 Tax=Leifsonia sp. Root4 TaxID=1736525 RepID=UPI0006FF9B73|nr:DUF2142 domain-containing protein [Leifsonia sp. Root4]KQW07858.1 hypothetical protein ASC66_02500 [Leifsonia sp. Root4]